MRPTGRDQWPSEVWPEPLIDGLRHADLGIVGKTIAAAPARSRLIGAHSVNLLCSDVRGWPRLLGGIERGRLRWPSWSTSRAWGVPPGHQKTHTGLHAGIQQTVSMVEKTEAFSGSADFLLDLTTRITRSATSRGSSCSHARTEIQPEASSNISVCTSRS